MELQTLMWSQATGWSPPLPTSIDSARTLVIAFGASAMLDAPAPLTELAAAFPRSLIAGCSTAGEILDCRVVDHSVVAAVIRFDGCDVREASAPITCSVDSFAAGSALASRLVDPSLRAVLVLSDGTCVNGSELLRGMAALLPPGVPVSGGLAGDGTRFQRTWVIRGRAPCTGAVTAIGFYGERLHFGHGSKGGWDIFGPERLVTRSQGNVLYELDGRPALELYKEYLGDLAAELPSSALLFPLAVRATHGATRQLVRTILGIDEVRQSMTFAGDIPEGSLAQLMRANFERLLEGASEAARHSLLAEPGIGPVLSIAISCVGRRLVLGSRTPDELDAALEILPEGTKQIGFYSYGEISPWEAGSCDLHNQTMTLTTISEA